MECSLCHTELESSANIFNGNMFNIILCEKCAVHLSTGGKFARIDTSLLENGWCVELQEAVEKWFNYKEQKGKGYSDKGKQSLITRIKNEVKATSEAVVVAKINNSIKNKWIGICWEDNSFNKPYINELFETTWKDLVLNNKGYAIVEPNNEGIENARRYYFVLFKTFGEKDKIRKRAMQIYFAYKKYVESLDDEKYCKTFYNWLRAEVPLE